jgi:predicted component of type VI protein secretion system
LSKLVLHVPGGGTRDIRLDRDRITIGRRADNDVHLPYPAVSADHAAVITVREDSFLEDLQSTNGTLVNGKRITKHFLRDHDVIDVGRVQLVYVVSYEEPVESIASNVDATQVQSEATVTAESSAEDVDYAASDTSRKSSVRGYDVEQVDELLAHLMESTGDAAVAVDIPPSVSAVSASIVSRRAPSGADSTSGVYLEVVNGPNAGQIAPMNKREFVLGRAGAAKAVIRREGETFTLLPRSDPSCTVNGQVVPSEGVRLSFGDAIEVAGVRLRFGRRAPLEAKPR